MASLGLEIAKRIDRARRIMVVGIDFAASLSNLLAYGLVSVGYDAEAPAGSAGNLRQKILLLGPKDLLIAISFGRCLQDAAIVTKSPVQSHSPAKRSRARGQNGNRGPIHL